MNSAGGLAYDRYSVNGCDEWLMRIGGQDAPPILFLPPLFEEMNRTRALIAAVMRRLAAEGFGCWLPDLPGTGESERALDECDWGHWAAALQSCAARFGGRAVTAAIRGGCLLDDVDAAGRWRLSPVDGASLIRDLRRAGLVGGPMGGYSLSPKLHEQVEAATPPETARVRTARLESDTALAADVRLQGPALWRRSEPGSSSELSAAIASDIASWARTCAAS